MVVGVSPEGATSSSLSTIVTLGVGAELAPSSIKIGKTFGCAPKTITKT
jgi:hypothetical protein